MRTEPAAAAPARRLTRVVATLGPASSSPAVVRAMVAAGLDVARLNFSHGTAAEHAARAARVRRAARAAGRPVGILADLPGPKVRLGVFAGPVELKTGDALTLTTRAAEADPARLALPVDYPHLAVESAAGQTLLLADGAVRLRVRRVVGGRVLCEVVDGGRVSPRAGLALPEAEAVRSAFTARDRRFLAAALGFGADFVAVSFVRRPEDVLDARRFAARRGGAPLVVAKIETRAALARLDEIVAAADAVMVARGDLGVELPLEDVPLAQKRIVAAAAAAGKPVIVATEMLESMRTAARPTRAEVSDAANAVLDGAWGLMLSAETAVGARPAAAVEALGRIAQAVEPALVRRERRRVARPDGGLGVSAAVADAGVLVAIEVGARAIVALTRSGATAREAARRLAPLPIYGYATSPETWARMTLYRGIVPRILAPQPTQARLLAKVEADLRARGDLARGESYVVVGGAPDEPLGLTNQVSVRRVR